MARDERAFNKINFKYKQCALCSARFFTAVSYHQRNKNVNPNRKIMVKNVDAFFLLSFPMNEEKLKIITKLLFTFFFAPFCFISVAFVAFFVHQRA